MTRRIEQERNIDIKMGLKLFLIISIPITYLYLCKYITEEHEDEKEVFILIHGHSNGPIS